MSETVYVGQRFQAFDQPESMGTVNDTVFWRCYWPKLDEPTALFAKGSSGLKVAGSSRNVIWPDDTEFLDCYPDALYPAEQAVMAAFPGERLGMVNLTPKMIEVYMTAYAEAVKRFPKTHTVHETRPDCHFLRHKELISTLGKKPQHGEYIAELTPEHVEALKKGDTDADTLKAELEFHSIAANPLKPDTKFFRVNDAGIAEVNLAKMEKIK